MKRLLQLLPLLPAFVLVGALSQTLVLPAALIAAALFIPQKRTAKPVSAIVPMALAGAIGYLANQQFAHLRELPIEQAGYRGIADNLASTAAALGAAAAIRRRWSRPEGGEPLTLGVALLCMTLTALFLPQWMTVLALTWTILFSLATLPEAQHALASWRDRLRTGITVLSGTGATIGLALLLPWLQAKAIVLIEGGAIGSRSGLEDHISLGTETDIKLSDERVLRLQVETDTSSGRKVDYLRGFVFTRYARGTWELPPWPSRSHPEPPRVSQPTVTVLLAASTNRVLLPLDSAGLVPPPERLRVDGTGVPIADRPVDAYSFRVGPREDFLISPPQSEDLLVPAAVRQELEPVARAWTQGANTHEDQLTAISSVLRTDFVWSLQSRRSTMADPVVDFVLHEHVGHCEYFASAMALLARIQGIPARVVGGYRVAEYNPLDHSYVVRKSNAHAWVEAWVEGSGWRSYDPTPETEVNTRRDQALLAALVDLVRAHPTRAILALSVLVGIVAAASSLRVRFGRKAARADEPALPNLALLVRAIARRTRRRLTGETLLDWARDVAHSDEIAIVERYSELRWGHATDSTLVEAEAARLSKKT